MNDNKVRGIVYCVYLVTGIGVQDESYYIEIGVGCMSRLSREVENDDVHLLSVRMCARVRAYSYQNKLQIIHICEFYYQHCNK